jgi:hypothetical protein
LDGPLFDDHPPVLGLNRSEQRLLSCALPGATDEQLAETLELSLPAVKKTWASIYRRVEDCLPDLHQTAPPSFASVSLGRQPTLGTQIFRLTTPVRSLWSRFKDINWLSISIRGPVSHQSTQCRRGGKIHRALTKSRDSPPRQGRSDSPSGRPNCGDRWTLWPGVWIVGPLHPHR